MAKKPLDGCKSEWVRVSKSKPCPICERPDWCVRSADGGVVICMRIASHRESKGKQGGWIHKIGHEDSGGLTAYIPPSKPQKKISYEEWADLALKHYKHEEASKMRAALARNLGVSEESLRLLCVGWGYDEWRDLEYSTWPQFTPYRQVTGIVRRYNSPVTDSGGNKLHMPGGGPGLHFVKYGSNLGEGPLCIVEGGSDVAALVTLGVPAIGRPSNLGGVDMLGKMLKKCKREIIVIGERDRKPDRPGTAPSCPSDCTGCNWCYPGLFGAKTAAEELLELLPGRKISWAMTEDKYKDSRAWFRSHPKARPEDFINSLERH